MAFEIPNEADASYAAQSAPDRTDIDALRAGAGGTGVFSGCAVTAQSTADDTVQVAAGVIFVNGQPVTVGADDVTIAAASSNPRRDIVIADDAGALSAIQGAAQEITDTEVPVKPELPTDTVLLSEVYVPEDATVIDNPQLVDKRVFLQAFVTAPEEPGFSFYVGSTDPSPVPDGGFVRFDPNAVMTQIDTYDVDGNFTWNKPTGAKVVDVILMGAAGGGGSGRRGATGTARVGGGGGGSGAFSRLTFDESDLGSSENVTVGAGGAGGAAVTANDTNGSAGSSGGTTYMGASTAANLLRAGGGSGGSGGQSGGGGGGGGSGSGQFAGASATGSGVIDGTAGNNGVQTSNTAAGAQGGGVSTGNTASNGGNGVHPNARNGATNPAVGTGGSTGSDGGDGTSPLAIVGGSSGSGGGGATSGTGGIGGDGGRGAGAGGGGASTNGANSGKGGDGGDGFAALITHF